MGEDVPECEEMGWVEGLRVQIAPHFCNFRRKALESGEHVISTGWYHSSDLAG